VGVSQPCPAKDLQKLPRRIKVKTKNISRSTYGSTPASIWREKKLFPKTLTILPTLLAVMMISTTAAVAQSKAGSVAPAIHPIPSAPKKSYTPASFLALPGLQCKLYAAEGSPSAAVTVFTDDDGYARFYAVRATASDAIQRLTMDCTDSAAKSYTYSVDLTADDTFAPRPLNLANERGTDRPALTGDPLSYAQSDLIQAGYGLRPDPSDTEAYVSWLAAASLPGRMLEAKRPVSTSHTVTKTTAGPWTGSVLTGAPNYISTTATFNVPGVVPGGDETAGTETAIWNGLGGFGTGSGLIQGGVEVETSSSAASYGTFREYCCGDPDSNGYGGAFVPKPGDNVFSQEWYCDSKGNLNLKGGYGCTFLQDLKSGAILSCTSSTGKPCWSVKALTLCSVKAVTNCMTLGQAAEFIMENQSGQLKPPETAFPDLTDQVTISGSAYSSRTGKYSQTISTDPEVFLLGDFTHSTSHMSVALGTTNQTYFDVSQFQRVSGTAESGAHAESIGVGPQANGSSVGDPWILGHTANADGNFQVYQLKESAWVKQPGTGTQIAVSPTGDAWVVNHLGEIFYWNGTAFESAPGGACATWIGVGPNAFGSKFGDPWILGCHEGASGYNIYQLQGSTWVQQPGSAVRIAVSPEGIPWVVNAAGSIFYWNGSRFVANPAGGCATDIAVASDTIPLAGPHGDVWILGCTLDGSSYHIYQLQHGTTWVQIPGTGIQISLSPLGGVPWVIGSVGQIYE
jgi:hypothetical protein